ncbi:phosphate ABC transporter substrate-binding protein PstS [Herminiimonas arsenitoxidans]|uniref:phosphate ABC transporter substrate-binding protein PstS n=1 Tax=Herminiimonas arsenitoxidans TaxID=1809410 RepID=UPI00097123E8|nr:phosphate ABC transporter substrate-binding protein PstS [Herminiimonas arsenitoxidans]
MKLKAKLAIALLSSTFAICASAEEITGAGSTFVYPILSKWSSDYNAKTKVKVNYQSIGSGGGIAQIKAATVDFGASDMPMKPEELQQLGLAQFPLVIGGVVPVVNIPGLNSNDVKFTGPVLADIFLGKIKRWNDPAIKSLNPGVALPDAMINVVHRSDGSGTTFNWVNYLSKVSDEWKTKIGEGTSVQWPLGVGGKGNEGVAAYVKQIKNSIGYVELAYAAVNKMDTAQVKNRDGKFVKPTMASFKAAASNAEWSKTKDFYLVITDAPGAESWPIAATVFVMMYEKPKKPEQTKAALEFFTWALEDGKPQAEELHYVSLPDNLVKQIEAYWAKEIK